MSSAAAHEPFLSDMDARVQVAIRLINQIMVDNISIHTLSRSVNLSPSRLRNLFRKETGMSPMRYLREACMHRAQELLRNTFLSIKESTFLSAAKDVSHLVRNFIRG